MPKEAAESPRSEKPFKALSIPMNKPPPTNPIRIANTGCSAHWSCSWDMDQLPSTHSSRKNSRSINKVIALNLFLYDWGAGLRPVLYEADVKQLAGWRTGIRAENERTRRALSWVRRVGHRPISC